MVRIVGDAAPRAEVRKTGMARAVMRKTGVVHAVKGSHAVWGGGMDARAAEVERARMDPARMPPTKMPAAQMPAEVAAAPAASAEMTDSAVAASAAVAAPTAAAPLTGLGEAQNEKRSNSDRQYGVDRHDKPPEHKHLPRLPGRKNYEPWLSRK